MDELQRAQDLYGDLEQGSKVGPAGRLEQVGPLDVFRREEEVCRGPVHFEVVDLGKVGMLKGCQGDEFVAQDRSSSLVDAVLASNGSVIVTADHGNAEQMWNPATDSPHTAHTVYDVPLIIAGESFRDRRLRAGGRLGDIAPTLLETMDLSIPAEMTGVSLLT